MTPGQGEGSAELDAAAVERLREVAPLVREAAELWQSGRNDEALAAHAAAVEILDELLPGSEQLFLVLTGLARSATEAGYYRAAIDAFAEAEAVARQVHGDESVEVATCLLEGGTAAFYLGHNAAARAQLENALALLRRLLPEDDPHIALALNNLSGVTERLGDAVGAERLLEEARAIALRAGHEGGAAKYHVNIGCLRMRVGQLEAAEYILSRAVDEIGAADGKQSLQAATCLAELMKTYAAMERLDDAAAAGELARMIREALLPKNHPEVLDGLVALGLVHVRRGDADSGQRLLGNALRGLVPLYGEADARSIGCYFDALHAARLATGNDYAKSYVSEALPSAVAWAERLPEGAGRVSLFRGLVDLACLEADASHGDASAAARDRAFEPFCDLDELTWDT